MNELAFPSVDERLGSAWLTASDAEQRLELLVGLLSRFNHDLRTPLNTIVGWTHLLQQGSVDAARSKHVAEVLGRNAREQTALLEEFVDDARAVLGVLKPETAALSLDELIAEAIDRAAPVVALHGVTLEARSDPTHCSLQGDHRRLHRLVFRLLAAVIRRTREGAAVQLLAHAARKSCTIACSGQAGSADWSEAALLDLRVCAFVAALHGGALDVDADRARASIRLRLPSAG